MKNRIKILFVFFVISFGVYAEQRIPIPKMSFGIGTSNSPGDLVNSLQILIGLTILTIAPSIIIMTTSFVRIIIVLHFIRQALGVQQMPPNQVLVGLALFLTFFIMKPTAEDIMQNGVNPYLNKKINQKVLFKRTETSLKAFMLKQTRVKDLNLFIKLSKTKPVKSRKNLSVWVVIPAYMISELTRGFEIGILIFIPFIIIDMIVATVLMSLGMMMLPPVMISIPFKLLLFVMVDGWNLIISSLVKSFN